MRLLLLNLVLLAGCSINVTAPVSPVPVIVPDSPAGPLQVEPHADPTSDGIHWTA